VRAYWKGDEGILPELAARLTGSGDSFNRRGRRPWASVNFITAHDGFTLNDVVSYNDKHNEANGENNQDGHSHNLSWNHGAEGPTDDPEILALRERQKRNLLATLLLSQGTPMMLSGDEFGHTQNGNNNVYCQDNELAWLNWENITSDGQSLIEFVRRVIALRQAFPVLRRNRFMTGEYNVDLDVRDVCWLSPEATDIEAEQWQDTQARCFGMLMDGRAQASGIKRPAMDATVLLVVNSHHDVVRFKLPEVTGGTTWRCLLDTNVPEADEVATFSTGDVYQVTGRSLVLYALEPEGKTSIALTRAAEAMKRISETAAPLPAEPASQFDAGVAKETVSMETDPAANATS
jgi:glycogen operon protein